jgi:hypothetical protein
MYLIFPVLRALKHLSRLRSPVDRCYYPYWSAKVSYANFAVTEFYEVRLLGVLRSYKLSIQLAPSW